MDTRFSDHSELRISGPTVHEFLDIRYGISAAVQSTWRSCDADLDRFFPFKLKYIPVTLVIIDGPGYTFRARKLSNGRRMSGRPVDF